MATGKKKPSVKKKPSSQEFELAMKYHLISQYRNLVAKRYDYEILKDHPDMPANITVDVVQAVKQYFLENLYPEPELRMKLDSAFAELENYILHPAKVWDLLGNLTKAIFR